MLALCRRFIPSTRFIFGLLSCCTFQATASWALTRPLDYGSTQDRKSPSFFTQERPFKRGHWVISPALQTEKPLANLSTPGMAYGQGVLVVAYNQEWVVGFSFSKKRPLWWFKGTGGLTAPPSIFGDAVLLGFRDGSVHKLNLLTGEKAWSTRLENFPTREISKHDNRLFVVNASQSLYSLDFASGQIQWFVDGGSPEFLTIRTMAAPTVHQDTVYFGTNAGEVIGVDTATGKELQRLNPDPTPSRFRDIVGPLFLTEDNKLIFGRSDGLLTCLHLADGKKGSPCWDKPVHSDGITTLYYGEGRLLSGSFNGYITAYDPLQGKKLWQQETGSTISSLTVVGDTIYSSSSTGKITALTTSGRYLWTDFLDSIVIVPPLKIDDGLYYLTGQNVLYGYGTSRQ